MKSRLAISHLIYHFLLFALTILLLLTLIRAGFNLWQLGNIEDLKTLTSSFVQGFRFDIATVGMLLLPAVVLIPLLAMFNGSVVLARYLSPLWMTIALLLVLILELVTPYFLYSGAVRPDIAVLSSVTDFNLVADEIKNKFLIPLILGSVLLLMMLYAFWARMDTKRFLRFPVGILPALAVCVFGFVLCVVAVRSNINPLTPALGPDAALISSEKIINEITLNSTFKTLHGVYANSDVLQGLIKLPDTQMLTDLAPKQ